MPFTATSWATIRARLADRYEGKAWWSQLDARSAFNEGLYLYNLLTGRWKARTTLATVAGQYDYAVPAAIAFRSRLTQAGRPISPSSRDDLNLARWNWRTETTTSGGDVPTRITIWAPLSLQTLRIWPADAAGGLTLTLDGVAATPILTEDSDTLDLGDEELNLLLDYALHHLSFSQAATKFAATSVLWVNFLRGCAEQNRQITATQIYRAAMGQAHRDLKTLQSVATAIDSLVQGTAP